MANDQKAKRSIKSGMLPGSLVHVGKRILEKEKITVIDYDPKKYLEKEFDNIEDAFKFRDTKTMSWINISGLHNPKIIEDIGTHYGVHPLVLEDILNTHQRPKIEEYDDYLFIVLQMLKIEAKTHEVYTEQLSLIVGEKFVLSFEESNGDVFDPIRERIRHNKGRVRKMGSDYLAYCLIDVLVDSFFTVAENLGEDIERLETELIDNPSKGTLNKLYSLKRELIAIRKNVWPMRDVSSSMSKSEHKFICRETKVFLRDIYDHVIQVIDTVETYRDIASEMIDIYLSSMSNKMNEVMKMLTIITTIFMPLSFVAGAFGMNFPNMPWTGLQYGYLVIWIIMAGIGFMMYLYFRKKKWL